MVLHLLHSSFIFSSNLRPSGHFLILRQYLYKIMIMILTLSNSKVFDNYAVTVQIQDDQYVIQLFDTAGQEDYDR